MVSTLQRFHCGFLKDALSSTKDTSINFFSLNFTSIESEGKRVSSSQSESTLWGGGTRKRTRANNGESGDWGGGERFGSKLGNLQRTHFLNVPIHVLPNISQSKGNQTIKLGQLTEYNKRNIFL